MQKKINAGARFFQTQAVYDIDHLRKFRELTKDMDCKILAGIVPLKSPGMAKFMTANVPGIFVPDDQIERLKAAGKGNYVQEGIKMAGEFIRQIKEENLCETANVPGIFVPDDQIERLKAAGKGNYVQEGIKMAGEFIRQIKEENLCDGVHIMAIGAEENVPLILDAAGL